MELDRKLESDPHQLDKKKLLTKKTRKKKRRKVRKVLNEFLVNAVNQLAIKLAGQQS